MYLVDTYVISEVRKKSKSNRGIELIRHRGDLVQADRLEEWLSNLLMEHKDQIIDINHDTAQLWGRLRVPHPENALDKQIAATALIYDLTVVTRNDKDFVKTGVRVVNPFSE
ncbi:MAG: PIN domain-containing protein [Candidatus Thiodiazotropha sp. 'RUGA']|nr:PIN domain-containing protein [Candidatus Thiodiazotropha sp. 'RUGA']